MNGFNLVQVQGVNETGFTKNVFFVNISLVKTAESEHRENLENQREHDK
jgi:hypothetical protein